MAYNQSRDLNILWITSYLCGSHGHCMAHSLTRSFYFCEVSVTNDVFFTAESSVIGNNTSLDKGTTEKIEIKWSEISMPTKSMSCIFEVEFMGNVASFSRQVCYMT